MYKFCFRCGEKFDNSPKLERHLKKKKICEGKYLQISRYDNLHRYDLYLNKFKSHFNKNMKEEEISCEFCHKKIKYKNNLARHLKNCKTKISKLNEQKEKINFVNDINKSFNNNSFNTIDNSTTNNNVTNNNVNIHINEYGKENLSNVNITKKDIVEKISNIDRLICYVIQAIHISVPENRSILYDDDKKELQFYSNSSWNKESKIGEFFRKLIHKNGFRIYDLFNSGLPQNELLGENINDNELKSEFSAKFSAMFNNSDDSENNIDDCIEKTKCMFDIHKDETKNTFFDLYKKII